MKYKLIENSLNDIYNPKETVLFNRGIKNIKKYLNVSDDDIHDYRLLDNIDNAVKCLLKHVEDQSNIHIIVDSDCDGQCSATIIYRYIKLLNEDINITYSIHSGKQHGISKDVTIPEDTQLLLIPDAGTNDVEQCKELQEKGIDIIILDHHIADNENPYAIIVNNQICSYPNKDLSGGGICYRFLQALDEETWNNYADNFLDLVALSNIADVMDIRSLETKRFIDKGLSKIRSKFFKSLINKQSYSINNEITINNIQFYIVPLINGLIRAGDYDEKEMMFRAFIETDEVFKYKPRRKSKNDPEPEEIEETIYDRVARLCSNAKSRQNNAKNKSLVDIYDYIESKQYDKNKIIIANITNKLDENLTGVSAIKVAEKYNKPCLLLRKTKEDENIYSGSGRNINNSPIISLKEFLVDTTMFEFVSGHDNAFGVGIKKENIPLAIDLINEKLKDVDFDKYYEVDFVIDVNDLDIRFIKELDDLKCFYGQGIKEANIVVQNLELNKRNINIMGKNNDTIKYLHNDEISFIKFRCNEEDLILQWLNDWENEEESLVINLVGKCGFNSFGGILQPQVIVQDYERVR